MTRPTYLSTACLPFSEPLAQRLATYRQHDIRDVELGARVTVGDVDWAAVEGWNGELLVHNYFPPPAESFVLNLASADAEIRARSVELVENALRLSKQIGAPFYSVHAGFITDPTGMGTTSFNFPLPDSPREKEEATERFVDALNSVTQTAAALGLAVLVENNVCGPELVGKLLLQETNEFLALFKQIDAPNLGILLDTGHLNVSAQTLGFDRMEFVETLAPLICGIHVHDNDGTADQHQPVQRGSWVLEALRLPALADVPLTVESMISDISAAPDYMAWLQDAVG